MRKTLCGADCDNCGYGKNNACKGCAASHGCPFGKECFIYKYIKTGGAENYKIFKQQLIDEFNALNIPGMPNINELYPINGAYVNLEYPMPSGERVKMLDDRSIYLCNQVEHEFNDGEIMRCLGLTAGMDFLLVSEYGENGSDPEIVVYKKR
jgi:hypothetical protein